MRWIGWTMKRLCCSKIIFLFLMCVSIFATPYEKSAIVYLGKDISYPMVGVHDYIFVNPKNINIHRHGFSLYNNKIYATIEVKKGYEKVVEKVLQNGYKNIYFIVREDTKKFRKFFKSFHTNYPEINIALSGDEHLLKNLYQSVEVVVFYNALQKKPDIKKYLSYGLDVIDIETSQTDEVKLQTDKIKMIQKMGMVPYISNKSFDMYGLSSKKAFKREIFTIIDEDKVDRILSSAHQYGAMPLEYMGYIQHLHNLSDPFPDVDKFVSRYAGVIVWLSSDTNNFNKLFSWLLEVKKRGVKIAFASNFGFVADGMLLSQFGIETSDGDAAIANKKHVKYADKMVGFEIEPQINDSTLYLKPKNPVKSILTYEDMNHDTSTPAAIMPWGGYAVFGSFLFELDDNNLWVINPFSFFKEALELQTIPVPDVTTHNGKRIMFTHIDGDGIMNAYESDPDRLSGDMIYNKILKVYKIPHSVSVIGAEIAPNGLYPEISERLMRIAKKMYALDNVEPATHTFTHTFKWGKITKDGNLDPKYRLNPKGYKYSLYNELEAPLLFIEDKLLAKNSKKKAQSVFWSGDCSPRVNALSFVYKHHILNINGGYTTISNTEPWLTLVSPLGLERGGYYQIYTGAQNENVYTNDWLGPFWGFKKVVQTFKMTENPRRLKPIDVYYHLYSGSKLASLNALKYIFNWTSHQDIIPIFTSEYIPKVMDFYEVSLAKLDSHHYMVSGMKNLKTLRYDANVGIDFQKSATVLGKKIIKEKTYIHLAKGSDHDLVLTSKQNKGIYIISTNGDIKEYIRGKKGIRYKVESYVDLEFNIHLKKGCKLLSKPTPYTITSERDDFALTFKNHKKAVIDVLCK